MQYLVGRIDQLRDARVLVVGDVMLDRYIYGSVTRISPEAPIPIFNVEQERIMPGGAGNVAINVASLGASVTLTGVIGDDNDGSTIRRLLTGTGNIRCELIIDHNRPTTVKSRFVAVSQQLLRSDRERPEAISAERETELLERVKQCVNEIDAIALSDYAKGVLTDRVLSEIINMAWRARKPLIVDPKRADFRAYAGARLIKPNISELERAAGMTCDTEEAAEVAARDIVARTGSDVLLTRSEKGMSLYQAGAPTVHAHSAAKEVYDVSGAGDTALAVTTTGLAVGLTAEESMRLANAAAGLVVSKLGTSHVTREELSLALRLAASQENQAHDHILSLDQAVSISRAWQKQGFRVGVTNGCFDILHAGHIALLAKARSECDRLIVALNSDESVRRLKGTSRPVQTLASRASVLAALGCVDLVVPFEQDTPIDLIRALRPSVLIKGGDYVEAEVVGGSFVKSYGGRVVLVDLLPNLSTTSIIKRARTA
jgi:D-beta-D-heptose 7-phosphate kinase/D-beta-D-heptose 1-phosphate adenosyltransferase